MYIILETEYQGHAIEIAKNLDIDVYDAIVTVSGDGIIHEVINGFSERPDARTALKKVPLGVIPGGTGNALSICMLGEKLGFDPVHTARQVIKGWHKYNIIIISIKRGSNDINAYNNHYRKKYLF